MPFSIKVTIIYKAASLNSIYCILHLIL